MFAHISTASIYVLLTSTILATAKPWGSPPPTSTTVTVTAPASTATSPASQCNTGSLQCCNSVQSSTSAPVTLLAGLLGIVLSGIAVPVGVTCTPITAIGVGGNSCTQQPVCCSNNSFHGVIAIGCSPVNLSL